MRTTNEMRDNNGPVSFAAFHGLTSLSGCNGNLPASVVERRAAEQVAEDAAKVSLTGRLLSQASRGSDVRFALVDELRQRIAQGRYNVSAGELAEKLMDSMRA